jgi:aldehyde:ferredoxin oxidoreductase
MQEYLSRKEYYDTYLKDAAGYSLDGSSNEQRLSALHEHRRAQYEKLTDVVYQEKGYDQNGIPTDESLRRLGLNQPEFMAIVRSARARVSRTGAIQKERSAAQ